MKKNLTKKERLRGIILKRIFTKAESVQCSGLKLLYRENKLGYNRVAFTTKKGFAGSVKRNRAKRLLREVYRAVKAEIKQGYDMVWISFSSGNSLDYHKGIEQLRSLLRKAKLFLSK
jgi:ribonuclease P protein component